MTHIRRSGPPDLRAASTDNDTAHHFTRHCDTLAALRRRRHASRRLAPLDCGCSDPWPCRCGEPPLTEAAVDAYRRAAEHVRYITGCAPLVPVEVLRALFRRGGDDRALAQELHAAAGGAVTR